MKKIKHIFAFFLVCFLIGAFVGCGGENVDQLPCLTCEDTVISSSSSYALGSSSSLSVSSYAYCIKNGLCLEGPYTLSECVDIIKGSPSNSCVLAPSSSSSSLSEVEPPLSSSSVPSSSSSVPSSSSSVPPSSSSSVPSSSSSSSSEAEEPPLSSSSSSAPSSSSSSVEPSSSSVSPSSSSEAESSSSVAPSSSGHCADFADGTEREHFGEMKKQFCDERDGKKYVYVEIGTQTWMAENLNYVVEGSKCNNNDPANCATYGSLYSWATAMALPSSCDSNYCPSQSKHRGICPDGWHIPNDDEWNILVVGGYSTASRYLKATSGWSSCGPYGSGSPNLCEDTYGFSALPGGAGLSNGSFYNVGSYGLWWSASSAYISNIASYQIMYSGDYIVSWRNYGKSDLYSVRCLQD